MSRRASQPTCAGADNQDARLRRYDVKVVEVDQQGFATKARFDFRVPLEHATLVFADWTGDDFRIITLTESGVYTTGDATM